MTTTMGSYGGVTAYRQHSHGYAGSQQPSPSPMFKFPSQPQMLPSPSQDDYVVQQSQVEEYNQRRGVRQASQPRLQIQSQSYGHRRGPVQGLQSQTTSYRVHQQSNGLQPAPMAGHSGSPDQLTHQELAVNNIDVLVTVEQDIRSCHWFYPLATRTAIQTLLGGQPLGVFAVRASNSYPGCFVLAVSVDPDALLLHEFLLVRTDHGFMLQESNICCNSVIELIAFLATSTGAELLGVQIQPGIWPEPGEVIRPIVTELETMERRKTITHVVDDAASEAEEARSPSPETVTTKTVETIQSQLVFDVEFAPRRKRNPHSARNKSKHQRHDRRQHGHHRTHHIHRERIVEREE
ncbi:uncharacterized protein MONBRDRAFT_29190 [Monosiga brevicollis MX1]|uniref:SH2 domain-containing protein n=1 Tax=Monosiga brevicollis TaxID=81824 RepID=A9VAD5_MONBE|nr:uncharacterized protein MONBRDRAFT_29190 [Monosiga brevicollis MX1]EDQ85466.1 predicted protein [Monosiga brevicollis MX1]|eukprot:XP_001749657.1 hypothetical protein [Monosiga brevicollis MX1]